MTASSFTQEHKGFINLLCTFLSCLSLNECYLYYVTIAWFDNSGSFSGDVFRSCCYGFFLCNIWMWSQHTEGVVLCHLSLPGTQPGVDSCCEEKVKRGNSSGSKPPNPTIVQHPLSLVVSVSHLRSTQSAANPFPTILGSWASFL